MHPHSKIGKNTVSKNNKPGQNPEISVILPVYNSEKYLQKCLDSISKQTFRNFEVIAIDDGSTDNSLQILNQHGQKDSRFKIFQNPENEGVSYTSNKALSLCNAKYTARMDADDIMYPDRLKLQYKFLKENPDHILIGGQTRIINSEGKPIRFKKFPTEHEKIKDLIYIAAPIQQPTIMVNRSKLPKNFVWYDESMTTAEDIDLMFRLLKYGKLANLKEIVLDYRSHKESLSFRDPKETFKLTYRTRKKAVKKHGYKPTIKNQIIMELQRISVAIIPTKLLYPIYFKIRQIFVTPATK